MTGKGSRKTRNFTDGRPSANNSGATPITSTSANLIDDSPYEETRDAFILSFNVLKDIAEASGLLSPLKATCALILRGLETTREINKNKRTWGIFSRELEGQLVGLEGYLDQMGDERESYSPRLQQHLTEYAQCLKAALSQAVQAVERSKPGLKGAWKKIITAKMDTDQIKDLITEVDMSYKRFTELMDIVLYQKMGRIENQVARLKMDLTSQVSKLISDMTEPITEHTVLKVLYGRDLDPCEEGTRTKVIERIRDWSNDSKTGSGQIFWLRDAAGTGKTTIAVTVAQTWIQEERLAGRFFFTPNTKRLGGMNIIDILCTTLAKDMAELQPSLKSAVEAAIQSTSPTHFDLESQFDRMIIAPLKTVATPLFLIIDALDNCEEDEGNNTRGKLIEIILRLLPTAPNVRLFLTSRPLPDIASYLEHSPLVHGQDVQLLDIHHTGKLDDIRVYVSKRLPKYTEEQKELIASRSDGLFIWAATACRLLRNARQPKRILEQFVTEKTESILDALYMEVLHQALIDRNAPELMLSVLQMIINAYEPISISTIQVLLPENEFVDEYVQDLGSVLKDGDPHRPIRVLHPTFREFILDPVRPNGFAIIPSEAHAAIALGCLVPLEGFLKCDILGQILPHQLIPQNSDIPNLQSQLEDRLSPALRYASLYWPYHAAAAIESMQNFDQFGTIISKKFLNWVELMSLRGKLPACVEGLSMLRLGFDSWVSERQAPREAQAGANKLKDAYQFLLKHQTIIQNSALHVYTSPLVSTPENSPLFQYYRAEYAHLMPITFSNRRISWSARITLKGHTDRIENLEFSSNGKRLASLSWSETWLWNSESGASIRGINKGNGGPSMQCISPDGSTLASKEFDGTISVWKSGDGSDNGVKIKASMGGATPLAISPTKPYIVTNCSDYRSEALQIWHMETGQRVGHRVEMEEHIQCVAFSPDGTKLACGGMYYGDRGGTIALWEVIEARFVLPSDCVRAVRGMGHTGFTCRMAFSPQGDVFVTGTSQGRMFLWDGHSADSIKDMDYGQRYSADMESCSSPIPGHHTEVTQIIFSTEGDRIASSAKDGTLLLWSKNGDPLCLPLKGHTGSIKLISFSPSGELLLSASEDQTVRVWNASTGEPLPTVFTGYTGYYSAIAISPDWTKLATGRDNFTIRITDITSTAQGDPEPDRTPHGPFFENPKGSYRDIVTPLIFTHEGFTAITRSEKNLAFWRLAEAGKEPTVISHPLSQSYGCMVASPSSNHLILTNSREFGIWQTETGEPRGPNIKLASPSFIASVACSTNHLIALGCQDRTIRLWDFEAQIEIAQLSSRNEPRGLAFSADGRRLAASTYGRFEIWSIESHNLLHSFEHWPDVDYDPLVSSPEGKYVAVKVACDLFVYSIDHPSQPTRLKTSCMEGNPPLISADGHYLVDGSSVWELEVELFPGISISTPSPGFPRLLREYGTSSLYQELGPLLSLHEDGWIHSAHPAGRLLPVTQEWLGPLRYWRAHGGKVAILGLSGYLAIHKMDE